MADANMPRREGEETEYTVKRSGSGGASGNRPGGDAGFTYAGDGEHGRHTDAYTDGWQSATPGAAEGSQRAADAARATSEQAAADATERLGNAAGSVGYTFIAAAMTGARNGKATLRRMGRSVMRALTPTGAVISTLLGGVISPQVGAVAAGGVITVGGLLAGATMVDMLFSTPYQVEYRERCPEVLPAGAPTTISEFKDMEDAAQYIYQALSGMGMSDENIAGILGNWQIESGIDPTSVETIYDEPFEIGPKKQRAWDVDFAIGKINAEYSSDHKAIGRAGIGFGQWTNERNEALIKFSESKGMDWHEADLQLAFAFSKGEPPHIQKYMREMVDNKNAGANSVVAATSEFYAKWEGIAGTTDTTLPQRLKAAGEWYAKMGGWNADSALGRSILAMADAGGASAGRKAQMLAVKPGCEPPGDQNLNNSDAARALASYVWPKHSKGDNHQNDGTSLYQYVHDNVLPDGDPYYASCDRTVATAVRWSGTDKDFPAGAVTTQYAYAIGEGKDKWELAGEDLKEDQLEAGDVLISKSQGHIWMYLSKEIVDDVWKGKDYDKGSMVGSGSLHDRAPTLSMAVDESGGSGYYVFRNKQKDPDKKMVDLDIPSDATQDSCDGYRGCAHTTPSG